KSSSVPSIASPVVIAAVVCRTNTLHRPSFFPDRVTTRCTESVISMTCFSRLLLMVNVLLLTIASPAHSSTTFVHSLMVSNSGQSALHCSSPNRCHTVRHQSNSWGRKLGRPGGTTAPHHGRPCEVIFIVQWHRRRHV